MEQSNCHPMTNATFLEAVSESFHAFLEKGTSRSTDKLKPLHGAIARDIAQRLGNEYDVWSQGYLHDKEIAITGRYIDKKVDITICRDNKPVAGIGVKFVMQNYSQNSNNYFENMLGETANIRSAAYPYFQVFVTLDKMPYYKKDGSISKWETITDHNISKYAALSHDGIEAYRHTPNKTLICVLHLPEPDNEPTTAAEYLDYYRSSVPILSCSTHEYGDFGPAVIFNDYETFMDKVYHAIKAI